METPLGELKKGNCGKLERGTMLWAGSWTGHEEGSGTTPVTSPFLLVGIG